MTRSKRLLRLAVAVSALLGAGRALPAAEPFVHPLALGARNVPVGTVALSNDATQVLVHLATDEPYTLGAVQVCASATAFPWTPPGRCAFKPTVPPDAREHVVALPRDAVGATCGTPVHLQVHAEIVGAGGRSAGGAYAGTFKGQVVFAAACCGNLACDVAAGETASSCPVDCAWGPAGTPLLRGAEVVGEDELRQLSTQDGFHVVTRAGLDARVAGTSARTAAARALVDGLVAANPDLQHLKPVEPRESSRVQRLPDGNFRLALARGETSVVVHGTDWLYEEVASSLTRTASRENQLALYASLYDGLPGDRRDALPAPSDLARLSDLELARHTRELARRVEQLVPNVPFQGGDGGTSRAARDGDATLAALAFPSTGCENHHSRNLYALYDWPLKPYTTRVRNQGSRGTCVGFATVAGLEARVWRSKGLATDYSEQELYASAKGLWFPTGNAYGDGLSTGGVLGEMVDRSYRVDAEAEWKYNRSPFRIDDEDEETYADSCVEYEGYCSDTNHQMKLLCAPGDATTCAVVQPYGVTGGGHHPARITSFLSLWNPLEPENSLSSIRAQLNLGRPVVMGFEVDEWFQMAAEEDGSVAGVVSAGSNAEEVGGHAVLVVGYISNGQIPAVSDVPAGSGGGYLIIKNSWGCAGDGGYMYVSYNWAIDQAKSAWAVSGVSTAAVLPSVDLSANKTVVATPGKVRITAKVNAATTKLTIFQGMGEDTPVLTKTLPGGSDSTRWVDIEFPESGPNGLYFYWAVARDQFGNWTNSNIVGVNVSIDTVAPQIQLSAASTTVIAPGTITLQAAASDNAGIARVKFFRGFQLMGEDFTAPYSLSLPVGSAELGAWPYVALAYDTSGNVKMSNAVEVTVIGVAKPFVLGFASGASSLPAGGGKVTLTWNVAGATSVILAPLVGTVAAQGSAIVDVTHTTSFVLSATNAAGTSSATAVVAVTPVLPPIVLDFKATPATLPAGGGTTTLSWNVLGPNLSLVLMGVGDVTGLTGKEVTVTETTTFLLVATNPGGTVRRTATVEVSPSRVPASR